MRLVFTKEWVELLSASICTPKTGVNTTSVRNKSLSDEFYLIELKPYFEVISVFCPHGLIQALQCRIQIVSVELDPESGNGVERDKCEIPQLPQCFGVRLGMTQVFGLLVRDDTADVDRRVAVHQSLPVRAVNACPECERALPIRIDLSRQLPSSSNPCGCCGGYGKAASEQRLIAVEPELPWTIDSLALGNGSQIDVCGQAVENVTDHEPTDAERQQRRECDDRPAFLHPLTLREPAARRKRPGALVPSFARAA